MAGADQVAAWLARLYENHFEHYDPAEDLDPDRRAHWTDVEASTYEGPLMRKAEIVRFWRSKKVLFVLL